MNRTVIAIMAIMAIVIAIIVVRIDVVNVFQIMSGGERYESAIQILKSAKSEESRFYALDDAAKESFIYGKINDAQKYAEELHFLLPNYKKNWNYGNAVQDTNIVFGRIAVTNGHINKAKQFLLAAGRSPGSPQMNSFGPNMSLAKDLLEQGENKVVLEYFELCRIFWSGHLGKLDKWSSTVKNGGVPHFGANLIL